MKETTLPESKLTKDQKKQYAAQWIDERGDRYSLKATVRYDDQCGNGHNSFSVTGDLRCNGREHSGGMLHDDIAERIPELAPFLKWHLTSTDGPMHYVANTVYHATEHGPRKAYVYFEDKANSIRRHVVKYCDIQEAESTIKTAGYSMEIDPKTAKQANLDYARSSAVWPDATQEQLLDKAALLERLPALMDQFKADVESLGFTY